MAAHSFNIPGGEILTGIGATWFVSYAYYENIDRSHQNWNRVSTARSRLGRYKNSKQYHKTWLQHIIAMNPENLNKNTIGLNALQTIAMAKALLAFLEQHPSQCNKAATLGTAHTERANTQPKDAQAQNVCEKIPSVPLCGIVRIIRPRPVNDNLLVPMAFPEEWQYPVNYSGLRMSHQTDCVLQKGDILFFNRNRILLVYEQPPMEIYASLNCLVLRPYCEDFCSEYLYYYLTDETIRTILHSMEAGSIPRISPAELSKLPVAHQANSHAFYQNKFFEEKFPYSYLKKHNNALSANQHACKPYSGDKAYIFISYCHKDTAEVLPIIQYLLRNGYRVWYDEGIDPGTEWDRNIAEHILNCGYFIAFITSNYLKSSNCKDELSFARDLEKKRFLVYLEQVDLPAEMKMRLARIQNIHKYTYTNDESFFQKLETAKDLGQYKD